MVFEHCALHCISIALRTATHLLPAPRSNWISCVEAQHRKCRYERWQLAISRIVRGCHMSRVSVAMFRQDVCCVVLESHPRLRFVIAVSIDVQAIPSRAELCSFMILPLSHGTRRDEPSSILNICRGPENGNVAQKPFLRGLPCGVSWTTWELRSTLRTGYTRGSCNSLSSLRSSKAGVITASRTRSVSNATVLSLHQSLRLR
jgi:hypothetical protein